jgi:hypothetical protein
MPWPWPNSNGRPLFRRWNGCQFSGLYGPGGFGQVRLGLVPGESGLVKFSHGLWNDCETARGSVMIWAVTGGGRRDPWNDLRE